MAERPTPTALAAREFMKRIDSEAYRQAIETRAILGGWAGARSAGLWDTAVSDAVVKGALDAIYALFRGWAAECDETRGDDHDHDQQ